MTFMTFIIFIIVVILIAVAYFQYSKYLDYVNSKLVQEACQYLQEGALLLDIRTKKEYNKGHLDGALLIETPSPLNESTRANLFHQLVTKTKAPQKIVVYCGSGHRSGIAAKMLNDAGRPTISLGGLKNEPLKSVVSGQIKSCLTYTVST